MARGRAKVLDSGLVESLRQALVSVYTAGASTTTTTTATAGTFSGTKAAARPTPPAVLALQGHGFADAGEMWEYLMECVHRGEEAVGGGGGVGGV